MKTTNTQQTAQRAVRTTTSFTTSRPTARPAPILPAQAEVWPGLTRAQLRDIVIDQIG